MALLSPQKKNVCVFGAICTKILLIESILCSSGCAAAFVSRMHANSALLI